MSEVLEVLNAAAEHLNCEVLNRLTAMGAPTRATAAAVEAAAILSDAAANVATPVGPPEGLET